MVKNIRKNKMATYLLDGGARRKLIKGHQQCKPLWLVHKGWLFFDLNNSLSVLKSRVFGMFEILL
ncbi:MAG: hypothetical protein D8H98_00135 [Prevotella sp.]|nr:MAG: hypothetical protein D8H98_00135 [Prevotella sp.]